MSSDLGRPGKSAIIRTEFLTFSPVSILFSWISCFFFKRPAQILPQDRKINGFKGCTVFARVTQKGWWQTDRWRKVTVFLGLRRRGHRRPRPTERVCPVRTTGGLVVAWLHYGKVNIEVWILPWEWQTSRRPWGEEAKAHLAMVVNLPREPRRLGLHLSAIISGLGQKTHLSCIGQELYRIFIQYFWHAK